MTYEDWLWLKLLGVTVAVFLYRFVTGLQARERRDTPFEPPHR